MSTPVNNTIDDGYKSDSRSQTVMEDKSEENSVSVNDKVKQYNDMLRIKTGKVLEIEPTPNDVVLMKVSCSLQPQAKCFLGFDTNWACHTRRRPKCYYHNNSQLNSFLTSRS